MKELTKTICCRDQKRDHASGKANSVDKKTLFYASNNLARTTFSNLWLW